MGFVLSSTEWVMPALALLVVAWSRFNSPPTNRSGQTFALSPSGSYSITR